MSKWTKADKILLQIIYYNWICTVKTSQCSFITAMLMLEYGTMKTSLLQVHIILNMWNLHGWFILYILQQYRRKGKTAGWVVRHQLQKY